MKKIYLTILLIALTVAFASAQQPFVTVNGHVLNKETGAPVAGQTMFVMLDSLYSAYYNKAVTDETGFYYFNLPFMAGTTQGSFTVYTNDCNGSILSGTGKYLPGNEAITIDFNICGNSQSGCEALFKYSPTPDNMLQLAFYDASRYLPGSGKINFAWNFGDSTASTEQNPVHTYNKPGLYNVCLSINSGDTFCSSTVCLPVAVGTTMPGPCENSFWYYNDSTSKVYIFEGWVMNGQADTWTWDFGDGTSATGQKVKHSFPGPNTNYTICLTTTGAISDGTVCQASSCQEVYIYIPSPCESSFGYYADSSGSGYTFEGWATNSQINSWKWDFGDGTTATGQIVSHSFTGQSDTYTVCLTTAGSGVDSTACTYSYCQDVFFSYPTPCENSFWYQADSSGSGYTFQGWSKNNKMNSWFWDFGDGTTGTGQTVTHTFANTNADYTVCLTTAGIVPSDTTCTFSSCQDVNIYIPSACESSFWYQADSSNTRLTFEGWAVNNQITSWTWDFGDGTTATGQKVSHSFADPTITYNVCLTTIGKGPDGESCIFNSCQEIYIYFPSHCENYFEISTNDNFIYSFSGKVNSNLPATYYWDFGDGNTDTGQAVTHAFGKIYTIFNVCLTTIVPVPDSTGSYACKSISCQTIYNGVDSSSCKAILSAVPDSSKNTYRFQNLTQSNYSYAYFDFGDGTQSILGNPIHTYSSPGIYKACLTIFNSISNCQDQACQEIWVDMIQPACQASFTAIQADSSNSTTSGHMFFNTSAPGYTNQKWTFGDGAESTDFNPVHTYATQGIYTACLTIWDSLGICQSTYCQDIFAGKITGNNTVSGSVIAGNNMADQGIVWLISTNNNYNAEVLIESTGNYHFSKVPSGSYYIYAMLTPGSDKFFSYMPTYYVSSLSWQGATIIHTGNPNALYPVNLVPSFSWSQGDAVITGTINWGWTINKADANPIANVEVVLYNSTGDPIAYTFTNTDGTFQFSNLPYGEYTLQAEMPGKATQHIAVNLSESSTNVNIDFRVNATEIFVLGLGEQNKSKILAGNPYPNPVVGILYLELNVPVPGTATVEVIDMQGRIIHRELTELSNGNNRISIETGDFMKGVYQLRINTDGNKPVQRRFIR